MTKFSIVLPVYNCEKYIGQAIESIINQSYKMWELILVDDGSTDTSGVICDQYAAQEERIKVLHTENAGEFLSRICGMRMAEGEYILGCDADDYYDTFCLEILSRVIKCTGVDVVVYDYMMFGAVEGVCQFPLQPDNIFEVSENIMAVISSTNHSLCNKAIKSRAVKKAIENMPVHRYSINADYALVIPILCYTRNGYYIKRSLYNYRIYEASMSHNVTVQHLIDIEDSTKYIIEILKKFEFESEKMLEAIYTSYLEMFAWRCNELLLNGKMSKKSSQNIHSFEVYIKSRKFEKLKFLSFRNYFILKIFRYRLFDIVNIMRKGKQLRRKILRIER